MAADEGVTVDEGMGKALQVQTHAVQHGYDVVEMLNRSDLLLTDKRQLLIHAQVLEETVQLLQDMPIKALMDGNSMSVVGFKAGLVRWLSQQADTMRKKADPDAGAVKLKKKAVYKAKKEATDDHGDQ